MPPSEPRAVNSAREGLLVWVGVFAFLAVCKVGLSFVPYGGSITGAVAVGLFLWVPTEVNNRLQRDEDDGLTLQSWRSDARLSVLTMVIVFPIFTLGFRGFLWAGEHVPALVALLTPYGDHRTFRWRLPKDLVDVIGGNIAVALAEEFFYRGYLLRRFSERWPPKARVLGVPFGIAMLAQTALFATGHLLTPAVYRLATFFPGLLFGWLAAKSGRVVAPAIVHAGSNMLIATLEASAFGA